MIKDIQIFSQERTNRTTTSEQQEFDDRVEKAIDDFLEDIIQSGEIYTTHDSVIFSELARFLTETFNMSSERARKISEKALAFRKGFGPLEPIFREEGVSDIWVVGPRRIIYEKFGQQYVFDGGFESERQLQLFVEKLAARANRSVDYANPITSFILTEGEKFYRIAIAIRPISPIPTLAIRRFTSVPTIDQMIKNGYFSEEAGAFFKWTILSRRNFLVSGGMGTGKTTLLAAVLRETEPSELPLLVEEVMEMPITNKEVPNLRRIAVKPAGFDGTGEIGLAYLLKTALQMKPTRVIVSEVRDGAIFYMLQAMQIGHEGSMSTMHAENATKALFARLPMMLAQSPEMRELSYDDKVQFIANSVHMIVHLVQEPKPLKRYLKPGYRHAGEIVEITEEPKPDAKIIFQWNHETERVEATGHVPERMFEGAWRYGYEPDMNWFKKPVHRTTFDMGAV
ncbi:MAG: Type II/IV secretion system ATP hydrolase TadA/VirB11/CpaF, TadA subfamily [Candidatus Carbobacillus altaicus]|uniref:Type II/IV secretion system ATP hydrolase TadA/VirB11/CpaF, TadA subfamily n=1 Tax=Candidatus Carbonibacillus altaicus TaxID=2163959 RepID=A0A2R6Y0V2_9BACL|nr:MAG: Type II/IV secretion system ATP hydrolase TadA/VirB11/CpaF, TadA subfamily [Candidatus Carbobacillus altaicus]